MVENKSATPVGETALTEIDAALDKTPSTKILGGLLPIPFKMWMYNDFVKYKKGFGKWMFNRLAANPPDVYKRQVPKREYSSVSG